MSSFNGPGSVSNGLVFAYDMGSPEKSWKGAPTTNLHPIGGYISWPSQTLHFWNGNNWVVDGTYTDPGVPGPVGTYLGVVRKYTSGALSASWSGNSYAYILKTAPMTAGVSYAMSAYTFLSSDCNIGGMGSSIEGASVSALAGGYQTSYDMSRKGSWQRQGLQGTASGNVNFILAYPYREGVTNGSFTGSILVGGAQVEVGTFPTPYTDSSRSNTQALLDITNRNTITVNNLAYASNNTFSFNGTSSDIRTPLFTNDRTNVTMSGWFFVNLGTVGTFLSNGDDPGGYCIGIGQYFSTADNQIVALFGYIRWILTGVNYQYTGWHMVTMTLDGSGTPSIYINGVLVGTYAGTIANTPSAGTGFAVGSQWGVRYANTQSGNVSFYNRALSATEVQQNFQALRGRYGI